MTHVPVVSFFFLSNFQALKIFIGVFLGNCEALKVETPYKHEQWVVVLCNRNQAAAAYSSLSSSFFFLSNFQILDIFIALFSGTVRPILLTLVTHVWVDVSCIPESDCCCLFVSSFLHFSFSPVFKFFKNIVALLSGIVSPRKLKRGTYMNSGWMYLVCRNQAAAAYSSLFHFSFSPIFKD